MLRATTMPRLGRAALLVGWMALLTYWSSQGNLPIDQPPLADVTFGWQHRLAHLAAYGLLGLLARWTFDGLPRAALLAVVWASLFGASDEWHQSFTPGRRPAVDDWLLDTLAAWLAIVVRAALSRTRWEPLLRRCAPFAVAVVMLLGVGLAFPPPVAPGQVVQSALDVARDARNVARQLRTSALG